jgi:hypothetical protein
VLTEIVRVGAVDDGVVAVPIGVLGQARPELALAEVAPLGAVANVAGIVQLVGVELVQRHREPLGDLDRRPSLGLRVGGTPADDGEKPAWSERSGTRHGEQRRVDPAGVAEQHPPKTEQMSFQCLEIHHVRET